MNTTLSCRFTLSTNHSAQKLRGPFELNLKWPMKIEGTQVDATAFPSTLVPHSSQVTVDVTISRTDKGKGTLAGNDLSLPIVLRVDYPFGHANVDLVLSSAPPNGKPLHSGTVTLFAEGQFSDHSLHLLNNTRCRVTAIGTFAPVPPSPPAAPSPHA